MDYEEAASIMTRHGFKVRGGTGVVSTHNALCKKLKYETTLRVVEAPAGPNGYVLRYFNTDIIWLGPDYVRVHDGGYFSRSTLDRFNEYLPRGFEFYGRTFPELKLRRPLGFMKTPSGVFPYRNGTRFKYDGTYDTLSQHYHPYSHEAYAAATGLSAYVEKYLDLLLEKGSFDETSANKATDIWKHGQRGVLGGSVSFYAANAITSGFTYAFLAMLAVENSAPQPSMGPSLSPADVARMLVYHGFSAFKKPRTIAERAQSLENMIVYDAAIPILHKQQLRTYLRRHLIEYIIERIGFQEVHWHRRER